MQSILSLPVLFGPFHIILWPCAVFLKQNIAVKSYLHEDPVNPFSSTVFCGAFPMLVMP
jgi:hypothetical protein